MMKKKMKWPFADEGLPQEPGQEQGRNQEQAKLLGQELE